MREVLIREVLMREAEVQELIRSAMEAQSKAYAPYSGFQVGAALLAADGTVYQGCNIENSSYGAANCAERTAFFKAISEGQRAFTAIAVIGSPKGEDAQDYTYPCGICRQVLSEFCKPDFQVIAVKSEDDYRILTLSELLPYSFTL